MALKFKRHGSRFKVVQEMSGSSITLGWIQDFYFFREQKPCWVFRMSPQAYLLEEADLLIIAGFLAAINEHEPLK